MEQRIAATASSAVPLLPSFSFVSSSNNHSFQSYIKEWVEPILHGFCIVSLVSLLTLPHIHPSIMLFRSFACLCFGALTVSANNWGNNNVGLDDGTISKVRAKMLAIIGHR
jgi:hypothetical protein